MSFACTRCGYEFKKKHHLKNHLLKTKSCDPLLSSELPATIFDQMFQQKDKSFKCDYCDSCFSHKSSKTRHQNQCTHKKDSNIFSKIQQLEQEIQELKRNGGAHNITINNNFHTSNNTVNNTLHNTININNFGKESYDHISDDFIKKCIINENIGIKSLIERIHFSEEAPQNKNVRLRSLKNNLLEVLKNDKWVPKDTNETVDIMIRNGYKIMNNCYNDNTTQKYDIDDIDLRIQTFLLQIMDKTNNNYFALRRRILALIIEYSDV
uniref:C2H2-type domain-containing protein n=1 Tax=viral metagenome TaxID=1070528 RepID=A0A6C0BG09_9ZZZZ